jgi:hypothetical protein
MAVLTGTSLALFVFVLAAAPPLSAARQANEYEVKAAFLYNFTLFVEWPREAFADKADPIALCVFGESGVREPLEGAVQGKNIGGHTLAVRRISTEAEARNCHVVFFAESERRRRGPVLESLAGSHVLTVGESEDFLSAGGMINLKLQESRVRIEISAEAASRAKCHISSKLFQLAEGSKR